MKKFSYILLIFIMLFTFIPAINASSYIVLNTNKYFRVVPGGDFVDGITDGVLLRGTKVNLISKDGESGHGCKNPWYKVEYEGKVGYICSSDQAVIDVADVDLNGDFEKEMVSKGFTESYLPYLKALHEKHPNWNFKAVRTNIDFDTAVTNENYGEISLIDGTDESLRSKEWPYYQNGVYQQIEPGWYVASRETVSYYLDPRNFLQEEYIFMFEDIKYNASIHTENAVKGVVSGTFLNTNEYINILMKTAKTNNVSPVYLASRIRQEKGNSDSISTTGASFTYEVDNNCLKNLGYANNSNSWNALNSCGNGKTYSGIYNYFNIGAYGSYKSPQIRGLIWANGGIDGSVTDYGRPWNSKEKAIMGGASYIVGAYVNNGQNTLYYQKFNVSPEATYPHYTHQYMTNVRAASGEAYSTYKSYRDNNLLNNNYEFLIPVYDNMPNDNEVILPSDSEGEEIVTTPNIEINKGVVGSGFKIDGEAISNIDFNTSIDSINSKLSSINANLKVTSYLDRYGNKASGNVGTGDTLVISNGTTSKSYKVVIYGDNNGDGKTSVLDLLRVQKDILGSSNLSVYDKKASDTNKDGKIDIVDILRVQKQLLGNNVIEQE